MLLVQLEQELNSKILKPLYLFYGEEKYLLENIINKIKKIFGKLQDGINYCCLDESNINNIINEIETPCFGFDKKLIIVKNAGLLKKELKTKKRDITNISIKLSEFINENMSLISENIIFIIIEENVEACFLLETLKNNGANICEFQKLKPKELIVRLKGICKLYNVDVDENVLGYLTEIAGTSMQKLINEIRKLIEYVGENGKITKADIDCLTIPEIDNVIFNLTDSLGIKNVAKALEILNDLIYLKENLQSIMINLYRHFKKIYYVKIAERKNLNVTEVLELKPTQAFLIPKYKKQATYFKEGEIRIILKKVLELDEKSKTGNINLQIGLETLLCSFQK